MGKKVKDCLYVLVIIFFILIGFYRAYYYGNELNDSLERSLKNSLDVLTKAHSVNIDKELYYEVNILNNQVNEVLSNKQTLEYLNSKDDYNFHNVNISYMNANFLDKDSYLASKLTASQVESVIKNGYYFMMLDNKFTLIKSFNPPSIHRIR